MAKFKRNSWVEGGCDIIQSRHKKKKTWLLKFAEEECEVHLLSFVVFFSLNANKSGPTNWRFEYWQTCFWQVHSCYFFTRIVYPDPNLQSYLFLVINIVVGKKRPGKKSKIFVMVPLQVFVKSTICAQHSKSPVPWYFKGQILKLHDFFCFLCTLTKKYNKILIWNLVRICCGSYKPKRRDYFQSL